MVLFLDYFPPNALFNISLFSCGFIIAASLSYGLYYAKMPKNQPAVDKKAKQPLTLKSAPLQNPTQDFHTPEIHLSNAITNLSMLMLKLEQDAHQPMQILNDSMLKIRHMHNFQTPRARYLAQQLKLNLKSLELFFNHYQYENTMTILAHSQSALCSKLSPWARVSPTNQKPHDIDFQTLMAQIKSSLKQAGAGENAILSPTINTSAENANTLLLTLASQALCEHLINLYQLIAGHHGVCTLRVILHERPKQLEFFFSKSFPTGPLERSHIVMKTHVTNALYTKALISLMILIRQHKTRIHQPQAPGFSLFLPVSFKSSAAQKPKRPIPTSLENDLVETLTQDSLQYRDQDQGQPPTKNPQKTTIH